MVVTPKAHLSLLLVVSFLTTLCQNIFEKTIHMIFRLTYYYFECMTEHFIFWKVRNYEITKTKTAIFMDSSFGVLRWNENREVKTIYFDVKIYYNQKLKKTYIFELNIFARNENIGKICNLNGLWFILEGTKNISRNVSKCPWATGFVSQRKCL